MRAASTLLQPNTLCSLLWRLINTTKCDWCCERRTRMRREMKTNRRKKKPANFSVWDTFNGDRFAQPIVKLCHTRMRSRSIAFVFKMKRSETMTITSKSMRWQFDYSTLCPNDLPLQNDSVSNFTFASGENKSRKKIATMKRKRTCDSAGLTFNWQLSARLFYIEHLLTDTYAVARTHCTNLIYWFDLSVCLREQFSFVWLRIRIQLRAEKTKNNNSQTRQSQTKNAIEFDAKHWSEKFRLQHRIAAMEQPNGFDCIQQQQRWPVGRASEWIGRDKNRSIFQAK